MHKKKLWWGKTGEYTPLKYIKSSGTQYIELPVQFYGDNYKIECKYDNTDTPSGTTPFGYQDTGSGVQIVVVGFNNENSTGTIFWNGTSTAHANRAKANVMTKGLNEIVIEAKNGTLTYSVNGGSPVSYETNTSFDPQTGKMWLFGNNRQSSGGSHQLVTMQFNYLRIYQNNEIKYNFISVLDKNGVPCVLETVNGTYHYNQGTGDFTYEQWDFTPCDYVYADGNAYTSTLWSGNSDTKMEMVFDIAEQAAGNTGSMGSRISANSQLLAIGYGTSALAADFNNSSYSPYRASIVYETNKKYRVYTSKEKRSIIDEDTGVVLDENNTLCTDTLSTGILLLGAETGISDKHKGNIYGAKVWEGATLIRDYIPVVDGDNKGCFYDKTLNALFYSLGASDFVGHFVENGVDYKVVKYLEGTGTQYIDTGYIPTANTSFDLFGVDMDYHAGTTRFGSRVDTLNENYCFTVINGDLFRFSYGSDPKTAGLQYQFNTQKLAKQVNYDASTKICTMTFNDDTTESSTAFVSMPLTSAAKSIYLFAFNSNDTPVFGISKQSGLKIHERTELVRNYIPALRKSDNELGMFNTVNRQFYGNDGTGTFNYEEV